MDLPNPHGSGAVAPNGNGGKGTAPRYSGPEQPASPLNARVPTSPSSGSSQRQGLEGKGLFAGKGGGQGFGSGTVPFGPGSTFAQGNVPFGAGPAVTGFQGQGFGPCTQFGCGGCGTGFCGAYGQPCTGGGVGVAQANTVPVSSSCPQTDVSGRTDGSQQFLQPGVFGCNPNVTDFQQVPGVSVLQQQQQFRLLQQQLQQQSQFGAPPGMWNSAAMTGSSTVPAGPSLGGFTPQQEAMRQIESLLGSLNPLQLPALSEVVTNQRTLQSRGLPEVFGQVPEVGSGFDFGGDLSNRFQLPGFQAEAGGTGSEVKEPLDIFSKNEKWLGSPPSCDPTKWSTREQEIIGFGSFVDALVSWATQASHVFGEEIAHSVKWPDAIPWDRMSASQRNRSSRLFAILKSIFTTPSRIASLIATFGEGISLLGTVSGTEIIGTNNHMRYHGFELMRQLSTEYTSKAGQRH